MSYSDFFDYEKNLCTIDNKTKIDVYKSPNKKHIKKTDDEDQLKSELGNGRFAFMNKNKNKIKKTDTLLIEKRRRGYSQKSKRSNNINFIIKDIETKRTLSGKHQNSYNRNNKQISIQKSWKSMNKQNKKKVKFSNKLVTYIDVENYKKYNVNHDLYNNAEAQCICLIY